MILLMLVLLSGTTTANIQGNWTAVKPAVDLETTPLEIKTISELGSEDRVRVHFYNSQGDFAGGVGIDFFSTPQYFLSSCISWTNFPRTLPTAVDKVWRISLTKTSDITLQIHCNNVEVVNFLLSNETCDDSHDDWRSYWSRDVEKIFFTEYDTASDYYRFSQGDWTAVRPAVDLETTPLEIKTNSGLGSKDEVRVYFYDSKTVRAGGVRIYFSSTPRFKFSYCIYSWTNFSSTLPTAVDKVWRVSLNKTADVRLQIHCNDVEVLNFLLSNETCDSDSDWKIYWTRDVEKIVFLLADTASDYYRLYDQQGDLSTNKNERASMILEKINLNWIESHCSEIQDLKV